jgi:SPOR domain
MSGLLAASHPGGAFGPAGAASPPTPSTPPTPVRGEGSAARQNALLVLAGVGVLLLAMGVGVLIGRSGTGKQAPAAAQVISVASTPGATPAAAEPAFSSDWASGTSGYTVQLQALPVSSTKVSAIEAAKSAASAKGAKGVGALRSEDFSSLKAGSYVIYSGVYHTKAQAEKALRALKKSFPTASVIKVSGSAGAAASEPTSASEAAEEAKEGNAVGQSLSHPAPPSVVQQNHNSKGHNFEQKSKSLPNVISTG